MKNIGNLHFSPFADKNLNHYRTLGELAPAKTANLNELGLDLVSLISNDSLQSWRAIQGEADEEIRLRNLERKRIVDRLAAIRPEEEALKREMRDAEAQLDRSTGPHSEKYQRLETAYKSSLAKVQLIRDEMGRDLKISLARGYPIIMIGLGLIEFNLNKPAFELTFSSVPLVASILAVAIGLLFMFFIHVIGMEIKTLVEIKRQATKHVVIAGACCLIIAFLLFFVALAREQLINVTSANSQSLVDLIANGAQSETASWSLDQSGWFLVFYNLAVLFTGFLLSFYRHDGHPTYEREIKALERASKALDNQKLLYKSGLDSIGQGTSSRMYQLSAEANKLIASRDKLDSEIEHIRSMLSSALKSFPDEAQLRANAFAEGVARFNQTFRLSPPKARDFLKGVLYE
jgi:hypothetical protein